MEEPIIILSDDEDERLNLRPTSKQLKKTPLLKDDLEEVVFQDNSKKKSSKNPTKQERQVFTWFLRRKFQSHEEAADYILEEKVWSRWYNSTTESGAKQYYRCNRVKYSAKQCSARIYTRFSPNTPEVHLFSNNLEHDHQRSEDPSPHHRIARTAAHVKAGLPHQKEVVLGSSNRVRERIPIMARQVEEEITVDPDDEFDEDCADEDDEDSYFIDTSLLRVEIDEDPDAFIDTFGSRDSPEILDSDSADEGLILLDDSPNDDDTFSENQDQTFYESRSLKDNVLNKSQEQSFNSSQEQTQQEEEYSPGMKISKIDTLFNINEFIMDIPKQKFTRMNWHQVHTFATGDQARNYIIQEKIWSKWYFSHTETGAKQYYRCNKAKYSGRQCAARIYLFFESNSDEVHLMVNGNDHDHDSSEFKATYSSLTDSLKIIIQKCCELKQKPKDIITKLEKLNLPLPSRYHLRKYIVELQENM